MNLNVSNPQTIYRYCEVQMNLFLGTWRFECHDTIGVNGRILNICPLLAAICRRIKVLFNLSEYSSYKSGRPPTYAFLYLSVPFQE